MASSRPVGVRVISCTILVSDRARVGWAPAITQFMKVVVVCTFYRGFWLGDNFVEVMYTTTYKSGVSFSKVT